jgi:hypothetical protein
MRTRAERHGRREPVRTKPPEPRPGISNHGLARLLQRDTATAEKLDPKRYKSFGEWVNVLPSEGWDETSVNVTEKVRKGLPDLAGLVEELRADCADVTILLRHYYLEQHGKQATVPGWDAVAKKPVSYPIGKGVTRKQLRQAVINLGTIHFQEQGKKLAILDYFVEGKPPKPIKNLKTLLGVLKEGDLLVWKKRTGVKGNFSGHVQTIKSFGGITDSAGGDTPRWKHVITVVQGTLENGAAKGEIQTKVLSYELLTGKADGDGDITFQPGGGEEEFFGAGRWR